ncbi:MAG: DinB family protein [Saprospiraceae bacterium]|nr:DinB family protein [Saprospiraceae bacterium]
MTNALTIAFDRLETQLDTLLRTVEPLSHAQQNSKPDAGSWSILQVFRHMMQSEGQILRYLRKKIQGSATAPKANLWSSIRSVVLNVAMRLPLKYKVPDAIRIDFDENYDFEKLSSEWKTLRVEMREFLETIDEETAQKEIFRHPVVGLMSLVQGLSFMQVHLERHTGQIERIIQHPAFPR